MGGTRLDGVVNRTADDAVVGEYLTHTHEQGNERTQENGRACVREDLLKQRHTFLRCLQ